MQSLVEVEHLGSGGYGDVMLATWQGTDVALKVMHGHRLQSVDAFLHEARLMSVLRHPHIVQFLGVVIDGHTQGVRAIPLPAKEALPLTSCTHLAALRCRTADDRVHASWLPVGCAA